MLAWPGSFLSGSSLPPAQCEPSATRKCAIQHQEAHPLLPRRSQGLPLPARPAFRARTSPLAPGLDRRLRFSRHRSVLAALSLFHHKTNLLASVPSLRPVRGPPPPPTGPPSESPARLPRIFTRVPVHAGAVGYSRGATCRFRAPCSEQAGCWNSDCLVRVGRVEERRACRGWRE